MFWTALRIWGEKMTKIPSILHIMAGKGNGGAETYSTDVMLSLHARGVPQCVVMHEKSLRAPVLTEAGLRVRTDSLHTPLHFWRRHLLRRLIAQEKPDIIHCWMRRAASLVAGAPTEGSTVLGWFGDYEEIRHFKPCAHLVGCTQDIVTHMRKNGVSQARSTYISTFPTIDHAPALKRSTLNTPENAKVLLTLSRLHSVKGLDTLMRAIQDMPDCYLWLAGDGPLQGELEHLAQQLGIASRVRFLGWRTDRGALLRAADICVLPSRYEPFGTVILEAWESKTPLVACRSAGPAAYVQNEKNGMLAEIDDAPGLAHALRRVLENAALRETLITQGYADYQAKYTREAVTEQWLAYYKALMKEKKP